MGVRSSIGAALLIGLLVIVNCQEPRVTPEDLKVVLDSLEHKLEVVDYRLAMESWRQLTSGNSDSLEFFQNLRNRVLSDRRILDPLRIGRSQVRDEVDRRRLAIFFPKLLLAQVESDTDVRQIRDSLLFMFREYRPEYNGRLRSRSFLTDRYLLDRSRTNRELAYRALQAVGEETADLMSRLFRMRNQQAKNLGYSDFFTMMLNESEFPVEHFLNLLEPLDSGTIDPYIQLVDGIRSRLSTAEIEIWDLPTAYASTLREMDEYFPVDSQLSITYAGFNGLGFNLSAHPIYLDVRTEAETSPYTVYLPVSPPHDVRLAVSLSEGMEATWGFIGGIGQAIPATYTNQSRPLFSSRSDGIWEGGLAKILADVCGSDDWLRIYAHVPEDLIIRYRQAQHRKDLVQYRLALARLSFEYEAYKNPDRDLNRLYWDIFERYMLVPRHDDILPWAATEAYVTNPAQSHHSVLADIISAQTLAHLERTGNKVVNSETTKAFLTQNYFRFGCRFPWQELLERGTGEPLQPAYLFDRIFF